MSSLPSGCQGTSENESFLIPQNGVDEELRHLEELEAPRRLGVENRRLMKIFVATRGSASGDDNRLQIVPQYAK